jgi:hypothetical protein
VIGGEKEFQSPCDPGSQAMFVQSPGDDQSPGEALMIYEF